jgi:hypothetical protein
MVGLVTIDSTLRESESFRYTSVWGTSDQGFVDELLA